MFVVAGLVFAMTASTYAEGTARYPEAGGSASFARHAFDELVSFTAAWAQMLVYVVTVAVSAFFVPHYLSVFWEPLRTNPWDIVGGAIVIVVLVALNVVGVTEAAKLSITLAVVDFATQVLLVLIGFVLVFSPEVLTSNIHWGVAPTWANLAIAIPVAMLAYTGVETVSNLAEEARDPVRTVPNAYKLVAVAVFAIYFTLPAIALSALPVKLIDGEYTTLLALPPEEGGYANDPILGLVQNLGVEGLLLDGLEVYVGVLAATILFIATNAGVIGASRITYSMATYRQMPELFRRLHPRFKTPWLSLVIFAGIAPILILLPGDVNFVGTLYSLGATLSFTVAHASLVRIRMADRTRVEAAPYLARGNLTIRGVSWPLFAIVGGMATGISFLVIVVQNADDALGRPRVDRGRVDRLRRVPAPVPRRVAARDGQGCTGARPCPRPRVPAHPRAGRSRPALRRCPRRRLPAGGRARRAGDCPERGRGAVGARRRRVTARGGAPLEPRARRGRRHRRLVRRSRHAAARAGPERGPRDRRRGRAPERGDHRARVAAQGPDRASARRLRDHGRPGASQRAVPCDGDRHPPEGRRVRWYRVAVVVFSVVFVGIGVALLAITAAAGGGVIGYLLGGLFVALGVARITLERRRGGAG